MEEKNPNNMSNEDLEKDVRSTDIDKSDAAQNHSTASEGFLPGEEDRIPELEEFDPSTEQDMDDLVHQPAPESEGSLPDPESTSLDEDDEYERGKISDK